jgi:hypothetical protein
MKTFGLSYQGLDLADAIQQRIFGVNVQMNEMLMASGPGQIRFPIIGRWV